jgi:hypothetical protein
VRNWIAVISAERWDNQLEDDAANGILGALAADAIKAFKEGRCTDLSITPPHD